MPAASAPATPATPRANCGSGSVRCAAIGSPVALPPDERRKNVVWVTPKIVIEAEYRGITHDGLLRQASFKGLREDKPAREVVRETPVAHAARDGGATPVGAEIGIGEGEIRGRQQKQRRRWLMCV